MDHPAIEKAMKTGYPNMVAQPEYFGIDYFGEEIFVGDDIVELDGELILRDNLERYLSEKFDAEFKTV
ncbi:hypothetical protein PZE06_16320 [Robertmurraya sp. DFI.2.37]|uniref:YqaI family protein n=1 Tax=Robertmurraya sp. DFI.2.37 TaxID=3031819 RepID=UPI001248F265|nr:hypothetical protein [Robertmurraya sp. DFI.2.37]MDF1509706.1 hypothetical protein [Robertmurraya sp. DFI.2.37]